MLSRQTLLNCAAFEGMGAGCDGGDVIDVLHYMTKFGLPDESCMPYALPPSLQRYSTLQTSSSNTTYCPLLLKLLKLHALSMQDCWNMQETMLMVHAGMLLRTTHSLTRT